MKIFRDQIVNTACLFGLVFTLCIILSITLRCFFDNKIDVAFVKDIFSIGTTIFAALLAVALYSDWIDQKEYDKVDKFLNEIICFESELKYTYKCLNFIASEFSDENSKIVVLSSNTIKPEILKEFPLSYERHGKVLNAYRTNKEFKQLFIIYHQVSLIALREILFFFDSYQEIVKKIQFQINSNSDMKFTNTGKFSINFEKADLNDFNELKKFNEFKWHTFMTDLTILKSDIELSINELTNASNKLSAYLDKLKKIA